MTKIAAIVGPTATGKSAVAAGVAPRLDAEIVSIDSMQIYLDMDIGTDKPTRAMRDAVPHHVIDLKSPASDVSVAEFQRLARSAIANIAGRGRLPLLVGGSGLYLRAVIDDLRFPPRSLEVRAAFEAEIDEVGAEVLHARLRELDPAAAEKLEPTNARRIVRALEAIELTGRPFSEQSEWDRYESVYEVAIVGLALERSILYERIEARVDRMLRAGLRDEVRAVAARGMSRTARQALGYRQVLEAGPGASDDEIAQDIVRATKRFARRQESWFRADPRIVWFEGGRTDLEEALVEHFREALGLP